MEQELTEMCRVIFASMINSKISNAMVEEMVEFAKNGRIPFKVNAIIDDDVFDNSIYDLGVVDLGEYMIYDSLRTYKGKDGGIVMTRYLRLTKGVGEDERELDIQL